MTSGDPSSVMYAASTTCNVVVDGAEVFALGLTSLRHVEAARPGAVGGCGGAARRQGRLLHCGRVVRAGHGIGRAAGSGRKEWERGGETKLSNPSPEPCDRLACSYPGRAHSPVNLRTSAGTAPPVRRVLGHDRYLARYRRLRTANPAARAAPRCSTPTWSSAWPPGSPLRPHGARRSRPPRGPSTPIPPCRGPAAAHTRWPSRS